MKIIKKFLLIFIMFIISIQLFSYKKEVKSSNQIPSDLSKLTANTLFLWLNNGNSQHYKECKGAFEDWGLVDAKELTRLYGMNFNGSNATGGMRFSDTAAGAEFTKAYWDNHIINCANHYAMDNEVGSSYAMNWKLKIGGIVDIYSDGRVVAYKNGSEISIPAEQKEMFNTFACLCESANLDPAGWDVNDEFLKVKQKPVYYLRDNYRNGFRDAGFQYAYFEEFSPDTTDIGDLRKDPRWADNRIESGWKVRAMSMYYICINESGIPSGKVGQERLWFSRVIDTPVERDIKIVKKSEQGALLDNVTFTIERTGSGDPKGFIQLVGTNGRAVEEVRGGLAANQVKEVRYTTIENHATKFITSGGIIEIKKVLSGDYIAHEKQNLNYGYQTQATGVMNFNIPVGNGSNNQGVVEVPIINYDITGQLRIIKIDKRTGNRLPGAKFKIQYTSDGWGQKDRWIKDGVGWDKYTNDFNEAGIYTTNANGEIYISNLLPGTYRACEISAPEGYAPLDRDKNGVWFDVPSRGEGRKEIYDKKVGIFRKIIEGTDKGLENFQFTVKELSVEEEYKQYYPELFNPNSAIYQDATGGGVNYWNGVSEHQINPCTLSNDTNSVSRTVTVYHPITDAEGNVIDSWSEEVPVEWTCSTHGWTFGSADAASSHCQAWNNGKANCNDTIEREVNKFHRDRQTGLRKTNTVVTDANGYGDITALVPDDDDYRGKFQIKEDNVGDNPYFNNDHPNYEDFIYYEKTIWSDKRRRMDIEGYIWEDIPQQGKEGQNREKTDGKYNDGENYIYPISVELKDGGGTIGQGVITANGMYRIRVGGRDGSDLDRMRRNLNQCYLEFTYNGLKYQSVYSAWPSTQSIASESATSRDNFNRKLQTIVSNYGNANKNNVPAGNLEINFDKNGSFARRINYEGSLNGVTYDTPPSQLFGGHDEEQIGGGTYTGIQRMRPSSQIDDLTPTEQIEPYRRDSNNPYADNCYTYPPRGKVAGKYEISANTLETGWDGIKKYTVEQDKITGADFGIFEREQPDISLVNDIERVKIKMNDEEYIYQYGEKMSNNNEAPQTVDNMLKGPQVKFESNIYYNSDNYDKRYKREIYGEQVKITTSAQNNGPDETEFKIQVYYKTTVRNESTNLTLGQIEIATDYDEKYDKDSIKSEYIELGGQNVIWNVNKSKYSTGTTGTAGGFHHAYGELDAKLGPGESSTFYTSYTINVKDRNEFMNLVNNPDNPDDHVFANNNIEVNAYTVTWNGQERISEMTTDAYAGVDVDSAAGNATPSFNNGKYTSQQDLYNDTYEDDNDEAPSLEICLSGIRTIKGNVFEDIAREENVGNRAVGELISYLGDGKKDGDEKGVKQVKVELVELKDNGEERLYDKDTTDEYGRKNGETTVLTYNYNTDRDEGPQKAVTYTALGNGEEFKDGGSMAVGDYEFSGFIPGEYVVKFTWGQSVDDGKASTVETDHGEKTLYVQQYKSTIFSDEGRYSRMISKNTSDVNETTKNRWYLEKEVNKPQTAEHYKLSNAIDDMETRRLIDDQTQNVGQDHVNENAVVYPDVADLDDDGSNKYGLNTSIASRTPAFDIGIENEYGNSENTNTKGTGATKHNACKIEGLDFGICKRPKTDMELEKRIERVKVTLANGVVVVDATVDWKEDGTNADLKGNIQNVSYPKPQRTDDESSSNYRDNIGNFKIEMDKEVLQGAMMEITYKYTIKNNSYLDYNVVNENTANAYKLNPDTNKYYKFGEKGNNEKEVEISPTKIIEYLDNKLGYLRTPDNNAPSENDLWEEITEDNNGRISGLLYDGRFNAEGNASEEAKKLYENGNYNKYSMLNRREGLIQINGTDNIKDQLSEIYKGYRTILREVTNKAENDYISLKAQEKYDDLRFVASKQLADTDTDLSYYNVVELAQLNKTSGAIPEEIMAGNNDPTTTGSYATLGSSSNWYNEYNYSITPEHDGDYASVVTIVPPTGNNTKFTIIAWTILGLSSLGILAAGIVLIKKIVLKGRKI